MQSNLKEKEEEITKRRERTAPPRRSAFVRPTDILADALSPVSWPIPATPDPSCAEEGCSRKQVKTEWK